LHNMVDRRGRPGVCDNGIRTRRSDRIRIAHTPHQSGEWTSTYHLRWAAHKGHGLQSPARAA